MYKEIMYNQSSIVIAILLFTFILTAYEVFFRIGRSDQQKSDTDVKNQTTTIQAGVLGLLALLLGFTFNMSLQRFDNRSYAVIKEANAIGTSMLRTRLLPKPYDSVASDLLQKYIDLRLEITDFDLTLENERTYILAATDIVQNKLWDEAVKAAHIDPRPVTTGYFISSLNDMIAARSERNAILKSHVPEVILFLLFIILITGGALMGYSSGLGLKRALVPTLMFTFLLVLVVFIVIDLDRPKRGLIKVKQDSLLQLKTAAR